MNTTIFKLNKQVFFLIFAILFFAVKATAQYEPGAVNYGFMASKSFASQNEGALGFRVDYAPNCYTTYLFEYNRFFSVDVGEDVEGFNEFAFGVNLIAFNWYPTTITAGIGYNGNDSSVFEEIEDDAFLGFRTGGFNHGAQLKFRAMHQVSVPLHIFAELNIKSLGRRYDAFVIGFTWDFNAS